MTWWWGRRGECRDRFDRFDVVDPQCDFWSFRSVGICRRAARARIAPIDPTRATSDFIFHLHPPSRLDIVSTLTRDTRNIDPKWIR
jgi:hypothetical protein